MSRLPIHIFPGRETAWWRFRAGCRPARNWICEWSGRAFSIVFLVRNWLERSATKTQKHETKPVHFVLSWLGRASGMCGCVFLPLDVAPWSNYRALTSGGSIYLTFACVKTV